MNIFIENHQKLLRSLLSHNVDFIIIGGYSVIFHGYLRTTGDIDIWLKPDNGNKLKLKSALFDFGIDLDVLNTLDSVDFTQHVAFHIDDVPERIDFLTRINLVEYAEADKMKVFGEFDGMILPFLHLNHLVLSKLNTGRMKDLADIDELQRINRNNRDSIK